ncbi:unnamed protein product [Cuscuta epithymum]|uniref:Transposase MuDR plant domain-containing protein n=1 Tax=Cuscuta epithymum TaxID=186058 RepID=A0AAV0D1R5_9ASTE|nr:unnamed protein product [Cuscuta epithymum]
MVAPPVFIVDDETLKFYLYMKCLQSDVAKLPLCVEFKSETVSVLHDFVPLHNSVAHGSTTSSLSLHVSDSDCSNQWNGLHSNLASIDEEDEFCSSSEGNISSSTILPNFSGVGSKSLSLQSASVNHPVDIISHYHPTCVMINTIYTNKADLLHHLKLYIITNSFQFRTLTSKKKELHVICLDPSCEWAVHAVRLDGVQMFEIRRFDVVHTFSVDYRQFNSRHATSSVGIYYPGLLLFRSPRHYPVRSPSS